MSKRLTARQINGLLRQRSALNRERVCEDCNHVTRTREFRHRPRVWTSEPLDRCPKCVVAKAPEARSNSATYRTRYTAKAGSVFETYGAIGRGRKCTDCGMRFYTYEVEYPLTKRRVPVSYCNQCGGVSPVRRRT
jgi:hypothetical protein